MTIGNGAHVSLANMAPDSEPWSANGGRLHHRRMLNSLVAENGKKWDWMGLFRRGPVPSCNVRQRNASGSLAQWLSVVSS